MRLTPIIDLEVPYFQSGRYGGVVTLERGIDVPITILSRKGGMIEAVLEDEEDKIEVRQVPVSRVQLREV